MSDRMPTTDCDGCPNTVVTNGFNNRDAHLSVSVPDGNLEEFRVHDLQLCVECRKEIVDRFVEDYDAERDARVDAGNLETTARALAGTADDLQSLAERLDGIATGDADDWE